MDLAGLGKQLSKFQPLLGSALQYGGEPVAVIMANELGVDAAPESLSKAMFAGGELVALDKLKRLVERNQAAFEDIVLSSARHRLQGGGQFGQSRAFSRMPAVLAVAMTIIMASVLVYVLRYPVPELNSDLVYMLLGQTVTLWIATYAYWIGTTRASAEKTRQLTSKEP